MIKNYSKKASNDITNSFLIDSFSNKIGIQKVEIGDGQIITAKGIIKIGLFDNIYFTPDLALNLLSVKDISTCWFLIEFSKNSSRIFNGKKNYLFTINKGSDNLFLCKYWPIQATVIFS